ncbi:hypothetical protein J3454_15425 [Erythrobacter sp. NFXS35]|uniref:hypothetical protein n=1 Tax=Erythrobacter sp. NFXS35 TaxID=2818436 RepID=UPI0032DF24EF
MAEQVHHQPAAIRRGIDGNVGRLGRGEFDKACLAFWRHEFGAGALALFFQIDWCAQGGNIRHAKIVGSGRAGQASQHDQRKRSSLYREAPFLLHDRLPRGLQ